MPKHSKLPLLSKSRFMAGLQCHKRLYLQLFHPEHGEEPDAAQQAIFDQGTAVGIEARGYAPGGVLIDGDHLHHREAVAHTAALLADGANPAFYEAAFLHDDVRVRVDILARAGDGAFDLYEVKSSTGLKDEHLWDVAIQAHVLRGAGIPLRSVNLLLVDKEYVYPGGPYDHRQLFSRVDVSEAIAALLPQVPKRLRAMRADLSQDGPPDVSVGDHCSTPYECPFMAQCWPPEPPFAVSGLYGLRATLRERLRMDGIATIPDIPPNYPGLSELNQRIREAVISGVPFRDPAVSGRLSRLDAPVFFMDFESFNPALPLFAGTRPYQTIPFQWSVHRLTRGGDVEHDAYLHDGEDDPRPRLLETLLAALCAEGSICVYSAFEKSRLCELREVFPEYAGAIDGVIERLVDLLPLVRAHVYHPAFLGSFSIKSVVPALVPQLGYDDLEIGDGFAASAAFAGLVSDTTPTPERSEVRKNLLDYCKRDTEALVELYRNLLTE